MKSAISSLLSLWLALVASWYGEEFRGRPTATGEAFDPDAMTCASRQYPLGTTLRVTHEGRSVTVRVNDRTHPRFAHRLDLSRGAFSKLGDPKRGLLNVTVEEIK